MPPTTVPRIIFYIVCILTLLIITHLKAVYGNPLVNQSSNLFFNNHTKEEEDVVQVAFQQLADVNQRLNLLHFEEQSRQISLPNISISNIVNRIPCSCKNGVCKCCGGMLSVVGLHPCTEIIYRPKEFSFEVFLKMNNNVWFRRKISGQTPPPFCIRPPRFAFAQACLQFHDIWFLGRNMHVCMSMNVSFQGFDLYERNFDCLLFGDKGIKIIKPEVGHPGKPDSGEVDEDEDEDDIEEYDENVV